MLAGNLESRNVAYTKKFGNRLHRVKVLDGKWPDSVSSGKLRSSEILVNLLELIHNNQGFIIGVTKTGGPSGKVLSERLIKWVFDFSAPQPELGGASQRGSDAHQQPEQPRRWSSAGASGSGKLVSKRASNVGSPSQGSHALHALAVHSHHEKILAVHALVEMSYSCKQV